MIKKVSKNEFIDLAHTQAMALCESDDRRRRLDGRLQLETLDIISDILPSNVIYELTNKGAINQNYIKRNIKVRNLHILNNNTSYIQESDATFKYYNIIVIKATHKGVYKIPTQYITGVRLTLEKILELEKQGIAKKHNKLSEVLGL